MMLTRLVIVPLLIFCSLLFSVFTVHLANAPILTLAQFSPLIIYSVILLVVYATLHIARYSGSLTVPCSILTLAGIGLAIQFRIGTIKTLFTTSPSQLALPIGIITMLAVYLLARHKRINTLERFWFACLCLSTLVLLFVLVAGRKYRGATFLPGNINPVEIIKPILIVFIGAILAGHQKLLTRGFLGIPLPPLNILVSVGVLWAPPMLLLLIQGDMGMFALMNMTLLVMLYAVTHRSAYLIVGMTVIMLLGNLLMPLTSRGAARLAAWKNPFDVATGLGWQPLQALVALYSGNWLGNGFGAGTPSVVPIVESDFAYIIMGEELGLIGCVVLLSLYVALVIGGIRIAERTSDSYRSTIATGITACLGIQTLLNVGGVVKAIPLTGIPLPLISHGGSSIITTLVMAGILLAIADETPPPPREPSQKPVAKPSSKPSPKKTPPSPKPKTPRTPKAPSASATKPRVSRKSIRN